MANNASCITEKQDDLANLISSQRQTLQCFTLYSTHTSVQKTVESNVQITFHPYVHSHTQGEWVKMAHVHMLSKFVF